MWRGPGLLLREDCEVVVELAISGVEEKLTIRKRALTSCGGLGEEGEPSWRSGSIRCCPHLSNGDYLSS